MFTKKCKYCDKEFESEARNTRYCSLTCCSKAQQKQRKIKQVRKRKRKEYSENVEINRVLSAAYTLAKKVSDLFDLDRTCHCQEFYLEGDCTEDIQLHHRNFNPFDNRPENLIWLCTSHHAKLHSNSNDVNIIKVFNQSADKEGDIAVNFPLVLESALTGSDKEVG